MISCFDPRLAAGRTQAGQIGFARIVKRFGVYRRFYRRRNNLTYREDERLTPSRMGYLIGYQIAAKLAAQHSLLELAHLRDPELRFMMKREVRLLAEQPEPQVIGEK